MVCFKNIASGVMVMCIGVSVQPKYVYTTFDVPGASDSRMGLVRSETIPRVCWPVESGHLVESRQAKRTLHFAMPGGVVSASDRDLNSW